MNDGVTIVKAINQRIEKNSFRIPGGVEAINKYFFEGKLVRVSGLEP